MKLKKIIFILGISLILMILAYSKVNAATYNIAATSTDVNQDDNVTINVSFTAAAWNITVSGDKITGDSYASHTEDLSEVTTSKSFTMDTSKEGKYTVTISGDITDKDGKTILVNKSVTVNVTKKEEPQPEEPKPEEPQPEDPKPEEPQQPEPEQPQQPTVTFTEKNKTMYVTVDKLNIRPSYNTGSNPIGTLYKGDAINVIAIGSNGWYKIKTSNGQEGYVASGSGNEKYLTDTKPEQDNESSISTLSKITVNPGNLNETFSKDKQSYTMTVDSNTDSVEITATPTDENAKVTVIGNTGLTTGTGNVITIRVLAQNGSTRTYKIQVTKLASEDENPNIIDEEPTEEKKLGLTSLNIEKIKLTPTFKTDVYEYTATLTDQTIEKLNVNAVASFEDAKIEVIGANEIKNGENVITITVTSVDGENTVTYQVIVNKTLPTAVTKTEPKQEGDNTKLFLGVGIVVAIAVLAVIIIIISKKSKAKPMKIFEDGDFNEIGEGYNTTPDEEYKSNSEEVEEDEYYDEDDDDDWGTPKKGFLNKIKRSGRHF